MVKTVPGLVQEKGPGKTNFKNYIQLEPWQGGGVAGGGQARTGHGNWFQSMIPIKLNGNGSVLLSKNSVPSENNFGRGSVKHFRPKGSQRYGTGDATIGSNFRGIAPDTNKNDETKMNFSDTNYENKTSDDDEESEIEWPDISNYTEEQQNELAERLKSSYNEFMNEDDNDDDDENDEESEIEWPDISNYTEEQKNELVERLKSSYANEFRE
jgi:hypothetical protein